MKTDEPAAPANLTVAQLGKVLSQKSAPAQTETETPVAKAATPPATREPQTTEGEEGAAPNAPVLSQTEADENTEVESGAELNGASPETPESSEETPEAPEPETPEAPQLPTELSDAIEIAKGDGKKGVAQLLQRVSKLVDQRDTERNKRLSAESRLSELETELETARTEKPTPSPTPGTSPAVAKLTQGIAEVDGFIRLLRGMRDGGEMPDGDGGTVTLTAEQVTEHLDQLRDKRTELVTERKLVEQQTKEKFDATFQQIRTAAAKLYPWLTQEQSPERARMKKFLQALPGLQQMPDHELILARYFRGEAAEKAALQAKAPAATRKAPPATEPTAVNTSTPSGKAGPADEVTKAKAVVKAAEEQFKKTGKVADMQALETAKRKLARLQK